MNSDLVLIFAVLLSALSVQSTYLVLTFRRKLDEAIERVRADLTPITSAPRVVTEAEVIQYMAALSPAELGELGEKVYDERMKRAE